MNIRIEPCYIKKDKKLRQVALAKELKFLSYKYLLHNPLVEEDMRFLLAYHYTGRFLTKYFKTQIVNYCVVTRNPRWVFKKVHFSRQTFKNAVTTGTFMGIRKACW